MEKLIDLCSYPVKDVLHILLSDKTTKKNIIFATDSYKDYGADCSETSYITKEKLLGFDSLAIQPRVTKSLEAQKQRTKVKAEVMTPSWIVCKMNSYCDEDWFGRADVFEIQGDKTWTPTENKIEFPEGKTWQQYVDSRRLEITCGEAPYIVSRYDVTTGEIIPIKNRTGILDRKLRIVNENAADEIEWKKWAVRAFQSVYGYEWQGDNLLIARINLLNTYADYYENRLGKKPDKQELRSIANIISWNLWQMDAFTGTVPLHAIEDNSKTVTDDPEWESIFFNETEEKQPEAEPCRIWDWRLCNAIDFNSVKRRA